MKREERSAKAAGLPAALLWIVFGITLVIRVMAGDGGMLAAEMLQAAPPEVSGLPAEEYPDVGAMIASYLTGGTEEFRRGFFMRRIVSEAQFLYVFLIKKRNIRSEKNDR